MTSIEFASVWDAGKARDVETRGSPLRDFTAKTRQLDPIHPGEILQEEFMQPLGISINRLARDLHVPPNRIHSIVHGLRAITARTTRCDWEPHFGVTPELWLNLQNRIRPSIGASDGRRRRSRR